MLIYHLLFGSLYRHYRIFLIVKTPRPSLVRWLRLTIIGDDPPLNVNSSRLHSLRGRVTLSCLLLWYLNFMSFLKILDIELMAFFTANQSCFGKGTRSGEESKRKRYHWFHNQSRFGKGTLCGEESKRKRCHWFHTRWRKWIWRKAEE